MSSLFDWFTSTIITTEKGTKAAEKEVEEDWVLFEELEQKEDDCSSSIATIEPVKVIQKEGKVHTAQIPDEIQAPNMSLAYALEQRIAEIKSTMANENIPRVHGALAELKDKELKMRKMRKGKRRS